MRQRGASSGVALHRQHRADIGFACIQQCGVRAAQRSGAFCGLQAESRGGGQLAGAGPKRRYDAFWAQPIFESIGIPMERSIVRTAETALATTPTTSSCDSMLNCGSETSERHELHGALDSRHNPATA